MAVLLNPLLTILVGPERGIELFTIQTVPLHTSLEEEPVWEDIRSRVILFVERPMAAQLIVEISSKSQANLTRVLALEPVKRDIDSKFSRIAGQHPHQNRLN